MIGALTENALLRSLLPEDAARLAPHLERVELRMNGVLYEMEDPVTWIYFPEVGLLSLITVMVSGDAIETSIVGREGCVGFIEALGAGIMFSRVIVTIPGEAYRVHARHYREAFDASAAMRRAVSSLSELMLTESRQAIACHMLHNVEKRFNRWLLECQDLAGGLSLLPLKQEFLAVMLGVSRTTITQIAHAAQEKGWIRYIRGAFEILDREALEHGACECRASILRLRRQLQPRSVLAWPMQAQTVVSPD